MAMSATTSRTTLHCMTHNIEGTDTPAQRHASFRAAVQRCVGGIGVLNEINPADAAHHRGVLLALGLRWFRKGQNAIVWDPRVIKKDRVVARRIMHGGHVGPDGVAGRGNDERVGPDRWALKFLGTVLATGRKIMVVGVHKVAKAFTEHTWRQWLWRRSTRRTARIVRVSLRRYPHGFIAGDENAPFLVDYPGIADRAVKTPASHGRAHYDQVHVFGQAKASNVGEFATASDHDGVKWDLTV
jgi:hypothetical protein